MDARKRREERTQLMRPSCSAAKTTILKALFYFQFPRQLLAPTVPSTFKSRHIL